MSVSKWAKPMIAASLCLVLAQPAIGAVPAHTGPTTPQSHNGQANITMAADNLPPANPTSLSSSSHTIGAWSANNIINVNWSSAADVDSGLDGYSVLWDHAPATLPPAVKTLEDDPRYAPVVRQ